MKSVILYEDEHLVVVHRPAKGRPTLITFSDLTFRPQRTKIWGEDVARKLGVNAIGFVARRENWFPVASVAAAAPAVREAIGEGPAVTYGYSMGGYAALKHAALLGAGQSFAVCPQSSIAPADVPDDARFHRFYHAEQHAGMAVRPGEPGSFSVLLADPYMPEDRRHAERLAAAGVHWLRTPFMDHASIWLLVDSAFLGEVLERLLAQDIGGLAALMRARRHTSPHWFRHAGTAAFRRGHPVLANRLWDRALELGLARIVLEQDIGRLLPRRVRELRNTHRHEAARDLALRQAALRPADFSSQSHAAHALLGMGEAAAAEAPFRAALALRADAGHIYQGLSLVLGSQGRTEEAVALCRQGIQAAPEDVGLRVHFGHLLLNTGNAPAAEAQFQAVLEQNAAEPRALLGLSQILAARGDRLEAIALARQVIEGGATAPEAFLWLGQLLLFMGEPAEAEPVFRDALAAAPDNGAAHVGLARALERTGRMEEARRVIAEAAALLPRDSKVQAMARRLGPPTQIPEEAEAVQASPLRRWVKAFFSRDE